MFSKLTQSVKNSRHVRVSGFRNPRIFCLWIPETEKFFFVKSGILGFGIWNIQLKESRIPLTIKMQNPSSTDKYWNPESKTVLDSLTRRQDFTDTVCQTRVKCRTSHQFNLMLMRKVYSDSARVVETGIIISKYGAERFVSDSFCENQLKLVVDEMPKKAFNLTAAGRRYRLGCHALRLINCSQNVSTYVVSFHFKPESEFLGILQITFNIIRQQRWFVIIHN